jgi:hypothetical protein
MSFMAPYPLLEKVCGEQWQTWLQSLIGEVGSDEEKLRSYLPMWLKNNSTKLSLPTHWTELADYEWSRHFVKSAPSPQSTDGMRLTVSPFARILRLNYEIRNWIAEECKGEPRRRPHILLITSKTQIEVTYEMAAVLDELNEEATPRQELFKKLIDKMGKRDWSAAVDTLIRSGAIRAS